MQKLSKITNYEKTYADFQWEIPEFFNFSKDVFDKWAEDKEKIAMIWVDDLGNEKKITYYELSQRSKKFANVLKNQGVKKGDIVFLAMPKIVQWWEVNLACFRLGAVVTPATITLTDKDIRYRLELSHASCVVCDEEFAKKVNLVKKVDKKLKTFIFVKDQGKINEDGWLNYETELSQASADFTAENTRSDDMCYLYFTSGTTGMPKMTVHTQASYPYCHMLTGKFMQEIEEDDLMFTITDTGWAKTAWGAFFNVWNLGAAAFVYNSKAFDPKKTLDFLQKYPITQFCAPPTVYRLLCLEDLAKCDFPVLKKCLSAGEPLNSEVFNVWKKNTGLPICEYYGQSETICLVGTFPTIEPRPGSMGKPAPGYYVSVIDQDGNELAAGLEGDIAVRVKPNRPPALFREYMNNKEMTDKVFFKDWYLTGDKAYKDEDGYFWFVGRSDDVIISSGYRIGPFEVESALQEHPAVAESAVVSSPDEIRGEVVKAFVILKNGYEGNKELVAELQEHVKSTTAPYKYPRKIEFVQSLPKTISGKTRRVELREKEWGKR